MRRKRIRKDSHKQSHGAMEHLFSETGVDIQSTRELVKNVHYLAHPVKTGFRRPRSLHSSQTPRDFSVLRIEACCSRKRDSLACVSGGSWRESLKRKNILSSPFVSIFVTNFLGCLEEIKTLCKHPHTCDCIWLLFYMSSIFLIKKKFSPKYMFIDEKGKKHLLVAFHMHPN